MTQYQRQLKEVRRAYDERRDREIRVLQWENAQMRKRLEQAKQQQVKAATA